MCGHHRHHHHHHRHQHHVDRTDRTTTLVTDDDLRASDAERERVISHLRAHAGEGRLTIEELDERVGRVYAAKTRTELNALIADLPRPRRPRPDARAGFGEHLRTYLWVMALLVAIWALTGMGYFWPVWPALGWGIGIASHASAVFRGPRRTPTTV
jgi:Domain of unknown function (DUF1707)/2TM domain